MGNRLMSRAFTRREKVMMLVLAVLLLTAAYYFFVVQNVASIKATNATQLQEVEDQIAVQNTISSMRSKMQQELDKMGDRRELPVIAAYDNLSNELDELNGLLATATSYDMKLSQPNLEGDTVRRVVALSFTTPSYDSAMTIISRLQSGSYRCVITDFSMVGKMLANGSIESVSTTLSMTYYETTVGATNLNGLVEKKASK